MRGACLLLAGLLAACSASRTRAPADPDVPQMDLVVDEHGPWREVAPTRPPSGDEGAPIPPLPLAAPEPAPVVLPSAEPPPRLPVPERRVTGEPAPLGTAAAAGSPEQRARERYLANPTLVRAASITFYCPARYAGEVRLEGEHVETVRPGRRMATGGARLVCRELRCEGERIVLQVRDDSEDVQLTARGDASLVSELRGHVQREEGARALLVTNDQLVPLR